MYCRTMLQFLHSKRTLFPFSRVLIWVLFPCNRMLKDNVTFVRFYSMGVLFPFSASARTGTVPVHYSPRVLSPFIRIMQDKVPFLHSKRVCSHFSPVLIWVLFPFFKTSHKGYSSPLSECCRIMLHFSTLTQRGYCSHSPQVLIWVLFPFLDYCSTRVQFTWIRMLQENIVCLCLVS